MSTSSKHQKHRHQWSTIVPDTDRDDRGEIRRCWDPETQPSLGVHGCRTSYEVFRRGVALNPLGPCMGFRAVSTTGFATPYIYSSYKECLARSNAFAAGLDALHLVEPNSHAGYKCLGLYLKNCMEWVLAEQATFSIGGVTVPFYDTLGPDTVAFILNQTETKTVVCARSSLEKLCQVKKEQMQNGGDGGTKISPQFSAVILVDGVTQAASNMARAVGLDVLSFAKVEAVGAHFIASTNGGHKHSPPSGKDVATFCYTSGTTGNPKGALITHENLTSAMAGVIGSMPEIEVQPYDRHISYLPLPHIFERKVMAQVFLAGASVAFYRGDPTLLVQDFQACRPTLLAVAPRVLNSIYDKIHNGINAAGGVKKKIFDAAVASKTAGLKNGGHFTHALYDRLIFNKIKAALGMDQLRFMVSGSAPLSGNVMVFFRCLLGIPIIEGYGQTEGAAAATVGHPDHMETVGHVGGPTASTEVVLVDVPEMGYLHRDTEHRGQECRGRGEICIRGPSVFPGYYRDEEKTREAIDDEGWLHSGDIGLWRLDGTLQIIDRKKNIFKLSQGEYVAPEKIENILLNSPLIAQCFVYGDSLQSCLVAIVVPDEEPLRAYLSSTADEKSLLLSKAPIEEICASQISNAAISKDIARVSQENGLHGFECVKAIHLEKTPFSVEADLMTPTFKLKRQQAQQRYEKEIAKLYAGLPPPASKL